MTKNGRSNNGHCDHVALWIYIYFSLLVYIRFDVVVAVVLKLKLRTLIGSKSVNITHACSASSPMRYELAYHLQLRMPTTHRITIFFFALLKCFRAWSEYWSAKPNNSNANSSNSIDWRKKNHCLIYSSECKCCTFDECFSSFPAIRWRRRRCRQSTMTNLLQAKWLKHSIVERRKKTLAQHNKGVALSKCSNTTCLTLTIYPKNTNIVCEWQLCTVRQMSPSRMHSMSCGILWLNLLFEHLPT